MNIHQWLQRFSQAWKEHNIEVVLSLFHDDVQYWETPSDQVIGKYALRNEWEYILKQEKIILDLEIFSQE